MGSEMCIRDRFTVGLANHPDWHKSTISVNALWPLRRYSTGESVIMYQGHIQQHDNLKDISILGDAAYEILSKSFGQYNGEFFYDEEIVEMSGVDTQTFTQSNPGNTSEHIQEKCDEMFV